jgi:hypothetical protein
MQYIFCVDKDLDTTTICTNYGIDIFSTSEFTTEKKKFNYQHQIYPTYDDREYELSSKIL